MHASRAPQFDADRLISGVIDSRLRTSKKRRPSATQSRPAGSGKFDVISKGNRVSLSRGLFGHIACAALALAAPTVVWAETLADAIAAAYDRDPQLVQQRYLQKARDENYVQSRAQYGPNVSVSSQGGYSYEKQSIIPGRGGWGESSSVTVTQPLYSSGRLRGQLAAAKAAVLGGREALRQVEQQVVQNVIQVYAAVLRDEARVDIARENVSVLQAQLEQNSKRQQLGDVTLTDVAQSEARLAAAEIQLASLEASLAVSRGEYLEVVGHNPGSLDPLPQLPTLPPSIDAAFDLAEQNNPSLHIAEYTEAQSSATAAATRGEQGPTVALNARGTYQNSGGILSFDGRSADKTAFAGVSISQPIFSGGAIRSRIREADARNRADQAGIDIARRTAIQSVTNAWVQLSSARVSVTTGQRQVDAAQQAFAGMSCEELNGLRSTIETLNAEQELQAAQLQLMQSRYTVYVSHAALLAATGELSAQQIADGITVYDPEANFKRVRFAGRTPFDLIAQAIDRVGSAGLRLPYSQDLTGGNVPKPDQTGQLAPAPERALMNRAVTPITKSQLKLPNGETGRCPLNSGRLR